MSYTEIYKFKKNGDAEFIGETKNSHRGAMAIWVHLEKKYLPPVVKFGMTIPRPHLFDGNDGIREIWALNKSDKVSEVEKICLLSTFDNAIAQVANIQELINAFREFDGETSLKEQADIIENAFNEDPELIAIGFNQTSVNADTWSNVGGYDEEKEESIPYNILKNTEHWFIFEDAPLSVS